MGMLFLRKVINQLKETMLFKMTDELNVQPIGDRAILERFIWQAADQLKPLLAQVFKDRGNGWLWKVAEFFDGLRVELIDIMLGCSVVRIGEHDGYCLQPFSPPRDDVRE